MDSGHKQSKRRLLADLLAESRPALIDPAVRDRLREQLSPVSESYLKRLLRESGWPLHPLVEGVRQDSLDSLERSLNALTAVYQQGHARQARDVVIEAKDHAKLALRRQSRQDPLRQDPLRQEMIRWMLVWLEAPSLFETWARLRRPEYEKLVEQEVGETAGGDGGDVGG